MNFLEQLREKIASVGLHRMVGEMMRKEGHNVTEVSDFPTAIRLLGTRIYEKNAEYRRIIDGIAALREVSK